MGPYPISEDLYLRAVAQIDRLNSGVVLYKLNDRKMRADASNCIHAVADVYPDNGYLVTKLQHGPGGTMAVKEHLSCFICRGLTTADYSWIARKLEVESFRQLDR